MQDSRVELTAEIGRLNLTIQKQQHRIDAQDTTLAQLKALLRQLGVDPDTVVPGATVVPSTPHTTPHTNRRRPPRTPRTSSKQQWKEGLDKHDCQVQGQLALGTVVYWKGDEHTVIGHVGQTKIKIQHAHSGNETTVSVVYLRP